MKRLYCYRQAVYRFSRNKAHNGMPSRGRPFGEVGSLLHAPSELGPRVLFVFLAGHTRINRYRHGQGHHTGAEEVRRRGWRQTAMGPSATIPWGTAQPPPCGPECLPNVRISCCTGLQCSDAGLNIHLE